MGKHALFRRDAERFETALTAIAGEVQFAAERRNPSDRRGLQTDFSFHHRHDRVTSTLTYGHGFASYFADWADKVSATAFALPDEAIALIVDFYLDGIVKTMAFGTYPDPSALNRGISRSGGFIHEAPSCRKTCLGRPPFRPARGGVCGAERDGTVSVSGMAAGVRPRRDELNEAFPFRETRARGTWAYAERLGGPISRGTTCRHASPSRLNEFS